MNASECVARGCALQCAVLSPTFKVREFEVLIYLFKFLLTFVSASAVVYLFCPILMFLIM